MAKRKPNAALFEVIARGDAKGLKTPSWVKGGQSGSPAAERPAASLKHPPGLDGAAATEAAPTPSADVDPIAAIVDGRVRLNFGYVSCLVISLAAIVLLAAAYKLGQSSRPAPGESTAAGLPPLFPDGDGAERTYDYDQAQQAALELLPGPGQSILIIEDNVASIQDAMAIQQYLWAKGLTPLVNQKQGDDRFNILDTVKVNSMTADELKAYQDRLAAWGKDPQWSLGDRYRFDSTRTEPRP